LQLPVAIVTGRTVDDVRGRLGFEPRYIVGNHGAEDPLDPAATAARPAAALAPVRERLKARQAQLRRTGRDDRGQGRLIGLALPLVAPPRAGAGADRRRALAAGRRVAHVFGGKMVVNAVPRNAPDKSGAVHAMVARCGADCAVFAGDDVNDEPVFESAPAHWLTIRIGRSEGNSAARFFLDSPSEMAMLLQRMLALLTARRGT
jgi:trehalose 6-phosphate phosphatase